MKSTHYQKSNGFFIFLNEKINMVDAKDRENADLTKKIMDAIKSIRFGYVQIIVQDAKVVQIDKTEKVRFNGTGFKKGGEATEDRGLSG